jgi:hypothetical protein
MLVRKHKSCEDNAEENEKAEQEKDQVVLHMNWKEGNFIQRCEDIRSTELPASNKSSSSQVGQNSYL